MKKIITLTILFIVATQIIFAEESILENPNYYFPKTPPTVGRPVKLYETHAFLNKWMDSIKENNQTITTKFYDNEYIGVGQKSYDLFEYYPKFSFPYEDKTVECTLYYGIVNKSAYSKFKSPFLYDKENNVCVGIAGYRNYEATENPYFVEPIELKNVIAVTHPFTNLHLKEVVFIPNGVNGKAADKYVKQIRKLYKKATKQY